MKRHIPAVVLLVMMGSVLWLSMLKESPTTDEALHLTRGLAYFWGPDARLSYAHPPLGNAAAAVSIALREPAERIDDNPGFARANVSPVALQLLGEHYETRRAWFFEARAMVALMTLGLGAYLYFWALAFFGQAVALCTLFFLATFPTLIAHGRLVTTDMPVTIAMVIAVCELTSFLCGRSLRHAFFAVLAAGIAVSTKYTGLALLPIMALITLVTAASGRGRYAGLTRPRALKAAIAFSMILGLGSLFCIHAAYRFDRTDMSVGEIMATPEPVNPITVGFKDNMLERRTFLKRLPKWLPMPVPYSYLFGLESVRVHDRNGHSTSFFGKRMQHGHFAYFPVLLAIKTPAVLLSGLAFAAWVFVRKRGRVSLPVACVATFCVLLLVLAMRGGINVGVRHVLPVMPLLALLGALGAVHAFRGAHTKLRGWGLPIGLAVAQLAGLALYFPDYISDFNLLSLGRYGGEKVSIVGEEWGQDVVRLGELVKSRGIDTLYYNGDSFTAAKELRRLGVTPHKYGCARKPPANAAWVAVNARGIVRYDKRCHPWLEGLVPVFSVGEHVFVYRTPEAKPRRTRAVAGLRAREKNTRSVD